MFDKVLKYKDCFTYKNVTYTRDEFMDLFTNIPLCIEMFELGNGQYSYKYGISDIFNYIAAEKHNNTYSLCNYKLAILDSKEKANHILTCSDDYELIEIIRLYEKKPNDIYYEYFILNFAKNVSEPGYFHDAIRIVKEKATSYFIDFFKHVIHRKDMLDILVTPNCEFISYYPYVLNDKTLDNSTRVKIKEVVDCYFETETLNKNTCELYTQYLCCIDDHDFIKKVLDYNYLFHQPYLYLSYNPLAKYYLDYYDKNFENIGEHQYNVFINRIKLNG